MAAKPGTTGTISNFPVEYLDALDEVLMGETFANRYQVQGAEFVRARQVSVPDISFPEASDPNDYDRFETDDKFTLTRTLYELTNDKQASFYVDSCDSLDEAAASLTNITSQWQRMVLAPFIDKEFFKTAVAQAGTKGTETLTVENIKAEIRKARTALRKAGLAGGDLYMSSDALALLEDATERHWSNENVITDTVGNYDGFQIFEVPDDRMDQDFLVISGGLQTIRYIVKRAFAHIAMAGNHEKGDGDLGQFRWVFGTIVRKNRKPGIYASKAAE